MEKINLQPNPPENLTQEMGEQMSILSQMMDKLNASITNKKEKLSPVLKKSLTGAYNVALTLVPHDMRDMVNVMAQETFQQIKLRADLALGMLKGKDSDMAY